MKTLKTLAALMLALSLLLTAIPMGASAAGKGDYDNDNRVDTNDVREMMRDIVKKTDITPTELLWGDMDMNIDITAADARALLMDLMTDKYDNVGDFSYAKPTGADCWGEKSIAVLGDSITFGSGAGNDTTDGALTTGGLSEYGYMAYTKKAIQKANGGRLNYGFASAVPTAWPNTSFATAVRGDDIHADPTYDSTYWSHTESNVNSLGNSMLGRIGYTCSSAGYKTITYQLRREYQDDYPYFCVYYYTAENGGMFVLSDGSGHDIPDVNGSTLYTSTESENGQYVTERSAFYRLSDCAVDENGDPKIVICKNNDEKPVTILGIGYYKELPSADSSYVTVNNYARGGSMLTPITDEVLDQAAKSDTLIVGYGYNDAYWGHNKGYTKEQFSDRINYLINACNENGTHVIVNDYLWSNYNTTSPYTGWSATVQADVDEKFVFFSEELKRLAKETNGVYIDQETLLGTDTINADGFFTDMVHPSNAGHKLMAENVVAALGLSDYWTETWA